MPHCHTSQSITPTKEEKEVFYLCPMHSEIAQATPGRCSECGMTLVMSEKRKAKNEKHEYDKHEGHSTEMFLRKFLASLILTIPVVLYSELPRELFGWVAPSFPGSRYVGFVLGSAIFFYGGWVFLIGAAREIKGRLPGMMTLIAIAISAAYLWSMYAALFTEGEHTLFWELSTLITIMLLGHWIEMKAVSGAQSALKELSKLLPDTAEVIIQNSNLKTQNHNSKLKTETKTVSLSELREGDIVLVRPGAKIPADGIVVEGKSEVNEALVTGESRPVAKEINSEVIAGTINGDGFLKVRVTKIGEHTFLAGIMRLVAEAQASKSKLQILADRAAYYLTVIAVAASVITLLAWLLARQDFSFAIARVVAVLVIACPHALGLAVPLVASISTTLAARHGFLVKQRLALESARNIDMVMFDKTGTLTKGEFGVERIIPAEDKQEKIVLQLAASVDAASEHPVAKAITKEAKERRIELLPVEDFQRVPGKGVQGKIGGETVLVGGEVILGDDGPMFSSLFLDRVQEVAGGGKTVVYAIRGRDLLGAIVLGDIIREESREAIDALREMGIKTAMMTGDSEDVAKWVAGELGIDEYFARVLPGEKAEKVKILQNKGMRVAMVGDGVNDAPALMQADLGIAIGAGTNVAIESAGIILVRNDPRDIVKIIRLSRATYTKMLQNLFWATGYNVVALPLAAGVAAPWGVMLEPALAAVFMSLSTVIVAVNALLLRRKEL